MRILRPLAVLAALLVALTSAACSSTTPAPTQATHPTSNFGQQPVPMQLWGTWEPTEPVTGPAGPNGELMLHLVFSEHSYAGYNNDPDQAAIGRAWAVGPDQIDFGARGPCESYGTYTWKIDAGLLTLSDGTNDNCQRRRPLTTRVWKKTSDSTKPADTDVTV